MLPYNIQFEADRRSLNITINSFGTELTKDDRAKLFPHIGRLYPEGNLKLAKADDVDQVKATCDVFLVCEQILGFDRCWRDLKSQSAEQVFAFFFF